MARHSLFNERWIPDGSTELQAPEANAVAYVYDFGDRPAAVGYSGKRTRPDFHNIYQNRKAREDHLNRWRAGLAASLKSKADWRAERKAKAAAGHGVPVGAIFVFSWGYDQTNVNFYQVTRTTKCTVTVREIASRLVNGMETGPMAGHVTACRDQFIGEELKNKRVQFGSKDRPYLTMASYGWCSLWDGKPEYCSWYA